jgi:uncharacterized protein YndB with AHSA1/START domain/predicted enzyme related to lactoylglutathione lyase
MSSTTAHNITLEVKRLIKAPRQRVFDAWTTPDDVLKWFGPESCQAVSVKIDFRVGGEYRIRTQAEMEVRGVYREIQRPSRIAFTWQWDTAPMNEIGQTLVTVDFLEVQGGTEVRLRHEGFPAAEPRDQHTQGWTGCLDKLEKIFGASSNGGCAGVGEFSWNELLTQDVAGTESFYGKLFGWKTEAFGPEYILFKSGDKQVGGMMKAKHREAPTHWLAYVTVENCDASARLAQELGASLCLAPMDVPTVGRVAVIHDPQGAVVGLFQPLKK